MHAGLGEGFVDTVGGLVHSSAGARSALRRRLQGSAVQRAGVGVGGSISPFDLLNVDPAGVVLTIWIVTCGNVRAPGEQIACRLGSARFYWKRPSRPALSPGAYRCRHGHSVQRHLPYAAEPTIVIITINMLRNKLQPPGVPGSG